MPFLKAGFNARNRDTGIRGWTRHVNGRVFAPAELRVFLNGEDFFWFGERPKLGGFIVWGERVVLGSWGIDLPAEHQWNLPQCDIETRRERGRWVRGEWVEPT